MVTHNGLNSREWFTTNFPNWILNLFIYLPGAGSDYAFVHKSTWDDSGWSTCFITRWAGLVSKMYSQWSGSTTNMTRSLSLSPYPVGLNGNNRSISRAYVDQLDIWDEESGSEFFFFENAKFCQFHETCSQFISLLTALT